MSNTILEERKIHNHGYLRLVNVFGDDYMPARAARMSFLEGSKDEEKDEQLTRYLLKKRHTSPFEQVIIQWEVKAPIFVFREWHLHRTASLNEMSGRYTQLPAEFYIPETWCNQDNKNKQSSFVSQNDLGWDVNAFDIYQEQCERAFNDYQLLLDMGVAKEQAHMLLPVSTYSIMVWSCNLHNLWHFLNLRIAKGAQKEIRDYALAMVEMLSKHLPMLMGIWKKENLIEQSRTVREVKDWLREPPASREERPAIFNEQNIEIKKEL